MVIQLLLMGHSGLAIVHCFSRQRFAAGGCQLPGDTAMATGTAILGFQIDSTTFWKNHETIRLNHKLGNPKMLAQKADELGRRTVQRQLSQRFLLSLRRV